MRASSGHVAHRYPAQHDELTRHLRNTTPATIIRAPTATHAPTSTNDTMSADDQLWRMSQDDHSHLRGIPLVGAGPGYIAHTQPERQTITSLARLELLALLFDHGAQPSSATAPALPPPSPSAP